ncbi:MAG: preprotein translocase subunit SecE [Rhodospirillales bacterium]|nr:preprotein translocase subunit SecE [Rhodospirillales bacterium]
MAKSSPAEYVRQVRLEAIKKVTWPTPKEAGVTALTVFAMIVLVAIFLWIVDQIFSFGIQFILGFGG